MRFGERVDKRLLIERIIARLAGELEGYERSARSAHAEATDEQSKAENKYDTRGLEASYLARGQSRHAAETLAAVREYQTLAKRELAAREVIDLGALVEVVQGGERSLLFLGPRAGGLEVLMGRKRVLVITPGSPIGQRLSGRRAGESLPAALAGETLVIARVE